MSRPVFLYENLLEDADLTATSTAADYDIDSVKTRIPSDRWRSASDDAHRITAQLDDAATPDAFAITLHDLLTEDPTAISDGFNRADEDPIGPPWTKREDGELDIVGNVATRDG